MDFKDEDVDDCCKLCVLEEDTLLANVKKRYANDQIYVSYPVIGHCAFFVDRCPQRIFFFE